MIINHNMNAMTAHRQMGINTGNQGKAIEKLSSGQRINRAGDDAAGLAISEKMRGQIRGLDGASRNAQDGVSLIQTAEGALNETHNILQRMRELSVQGANDTNVAEDREAITKEMTALTEEINRISTDTEFNGQKLLNGEFKDKNLQIGANESQNVDVNIKNMNADSILGGGFESKVTTSVAGVVADDVKTVLGTDASEFTISQDKDGSFSIKDAKGEKINDITVTQNGTGILLEKGGKTVTLAVAKVGVLDKGESINITNTAAGAVNLNEKFNVKIDGATTISFVNSSDKLTIVGGDKAGTYDATYSEGKLIGFTDATDKSKFISAEDLGLKHGDLDKDFTATVSKDKVNAVDVSTHEKATKSITTIDDAIKNVSSQRADLGALQNRLEHTIATNNNSAENLQAAESRIRDVDMAKEMMNLSKNNVLVQAAQSMLGQANQQPNQVLSLLR